MKKKDVLIIIPAYNEASTIGSLLDELEKPEISHYTDILVMNDASTDRTSDIVRARGHAVVTHIYNLGYGSGLQLGYKYAKRHGYKYVIQMDADGQHDPSNVKNIYKALTTPDENGNTPDIVLGSRLIPGAPPYPMSGVRRFASGLFSRIIKMFTHQKIYDTTTGLQGLNRSAFGFYSQFNHFDDRYPDANMLIQMLMLDFRVKEIPALMHTRSNGKGMHSGLKPIVYMIRMVYSMIAVWCRVKLFKADKETTLRAKNISKKQE